MSLRVTVHDLWVHNDVGPEPQSWIAIFYDGEVVLLTDPEKLRVVDIQQPISVMHFLLQSIDS